MRMIGVHCDRIVIAAAPAAEMADIHIIHGYKAAISLFSGKIEKKEWGAHYAGAFL